MSATPQPGNATTVATGGSPVAAVLAVPAGLGGGYVVNPLALADQGIAALEPLYVDVVTNAGTAGNGTTVALQPGQTFSLIPGQTTATSVNAATSGHKFTAVWW